MAGKPRHFFVNERHELSKEAKTSGGSASKFEGVSWSQKGAKIQSSIRTARETYSKSKDPATKSHYFLIALPDKSLKKRSDAKGKTTIKDEPADFERKYPLAFHRLGMDLLRLDSEGRALVHITPERLQAIEAQTGILGHTGSHEQARWAPIDQFSIVPWSKKVDSAWLDSLDQQLGDVILELQPLLTKVDVDSVLGSITSFLSRALMEQIQGSGTDYSGRQWFRAKLGAVAIKKLSEEFHSIQSLHPPLATRVNDNLLAGWTDTSQGLQTFNEVGANNLPVVGILDTGVEENHQLLSQYSRGRFIAPESLGQNAGEHGTGVASKVIFGHCNPATVDGLSTKYRCRFLDVVITKDAWSVEDKAVLPAFRGAIANYRDVRVFNMSFGDDQPLEEFLEQDRLEKLAQLRDLDNLIFSEDILVVVAAGNSPAGRIPNPAYPNTHKDAYWRLPAWARGFNTLVCGSFVNELRTGSLVQTLGWPSPFSRVGPGLAEAPVPNFSEHGGDVDVTYRSGFGVLACDRHGRWSERRGTSYAAPLLARKAAHAFQELQKYCPGNSRPYAALVKSFLALSAKLPHSTKHASVKGLSERTLGRGEVNLDLLFTPESGRAIFFWQGVIDTTNDVARVQVPIPQEWLKAALLPRMRLIWSWESPVHDGVPGIWSCRRVDVHVQTGPDAKAFRGSTGDHSHASYTIREKIVRLDQEALQKNNVSLSEDFWLLEISYLQIADYFPGREISPKQRVGLVIELFDEGLQSDPQQFVQALSVAASFDRLSAAPLPAGPGIPIKI